MVLGFEEKGFSLLLKCRKKSGDATIIYALDFRFQVIHTTRCFMFLHSGPLGGKALKHAPRSSTARLLSRLSSHPQSDAPLFMHLSAKVAAVN